MQFRLLNSRTGATIAERLSVADSILSRFRGLLFRRPLAEDEALLLRPCSQVHMFFMPYPIDVVCCSRENIVLDLQPDLKPWRVSRGVIGCKSIIELPAGTIARTDLERGDLLIVKQVS